MTLGNGGRNSKLKVFSGSYVYVSGGLSPSAIGNSFSPTLLPYHLMKK